MAVWHRAAQLQAEAAQRLEDRSRMLAARGDASEPGGEGFRRADVEAAAREAGIASEFVELALREIGDATRPAVRLSGWQDRVATRLLGTDQRRIEVARTIDATPVDTLDAMRRVLPAHPYFLALQDTVGNDPLQGATMIFSVPDYAYGTGTTTPFASHSAAIHLEEISVSLRELPAARRPTCEVVITGDLHSGVRLNSLVGSTLSAAVGAGGVSFGTLVGMKALALAGGLIVLPAVAGGALLGSLGVIGYGAMYRYYLRKVTVDLEQLLRAVDANARTAGAFSLPTPPLGGGAGSARAGSM